MLKKIKITDVRNDCLDIAVSQKKKYDQNGSITNGKLAIQAYTAVISTAKVELVYKKLTGKPLKIPFLEC